MKAIDEYSVSTVPIEMHFQETHLSIATAFVWQEEDEFYLITNWHNLTGRDPFTGKHLSKTAAEPDRIRAYWNRKGALGHRLDDFVAIKDTNGSPLWLIHPQHGNQIDAVALPLDAPTDAEMYPINKMPSKNLKLEIGVDVFILGYPFGIGPAMLPIWKRGSIASEPQVLDPKRPHILIDTASRPGMSGSPVIRRSWGTHPMEGGGMEISGASAATRFVGIYSGRLATDDASDAQLGMAWSASFVEEIVAGGTRDT